MASDESADRIQRQLREIREQLRIQNILKWLELRGRNYPDQVWDDNMRSIGLALGGIEDVRQG